MMPWEELIDRTADRQHADFKVHNNVARRRSKTHDRTVCMYDVQHAHLW